MALDSLPTKPSGGPAVWFFCAPPAQEDDEVAAAEGRPGCHFLDACALCQLPLRRDRDVYMCRGNVAFCSEECRQEWMDVEEEREEGAKAHYRRVSAVAAAAASAWEEQKERKPATDRASWVFHVPAAETVGAG